MMQIIIQKVDNMGEQMMTLRRMFLIMFLLLFSDISWHFKLHMLIESMTFDLLAHLRLCLLYSSFLF